MKTVFWITFVSVCLYILLCASESLPLKRWQHHIQAKDLEGITKLAAVLNDIDPAVFTAQIRQESNFNPSARSKVGAIGIAQIMPGTAKGWKVDPHDPMQSLDAAARNMKRYVRTYKEQGHDEDTAYRMALAAYNAGPGAVAKYGGVPPYSETKHYVKTILPEKPKPLFRPYKISMAD